MFRSIIFSVSKLDKNNISNQSFAIWILLSTLQYGCAEFERSLPKDKHTSMQDNEVSVDSIDPCTRRQFKRTARQVNWIYGSIFRAWAITIDDKPSRVNLLRDGSLLTNSPRTIPGDRQSNFLIFPLFKQIIKMENHWFKCKKGNCYGNDIWEII